MRRSRLLGLLLTACSAVALVPAAPGSPGLQAQDTLTAKGKKGDKDKGEKAPKGAKSSAKSDDPASQRKKVVKDSIEALGRPLFATREVLPFTLVANFGEISKDRDSLSTKRHPGTLIVTDRSGAERKIPVELRTRGHFRLRKSTCRFVNLQVRFSGKKETIEGTPFEGQKSLKLGAHCQDDSRYEQILRREYLAYLVYNEVTPRSFRARLAQATYQDSVSGKSLGTHVAMFIENEDDVAARQGGKIREFRRALFEDVDGPTLDRMTIFEYMIGNTDWSLYALHNVRLVVTDSAGVIPLAYDFDFSGLVHAPYAVPAPQLPIRSVRERLFRGPCRSWAELAPSLEAFTSRQAQIMALPASIPGIGGSERRDAEEFLADFFRTASDQKEATHTFIDGCLKKPGA